MSRESAAHQVRLHRLDRQADFSAEQIQTLTGLTGLAMGAVVQVAQGQKQLELMAPEVSGRLSMLADGHALDMVDVMADARRQLRRL